MALVQTVPAVRRLPLELLIEIFLATKALHGPDHAKLDPPPCAYLSHVCRTWRAAALMCQQLWSSVLRPHLDWTDLCLERCHSLPIEIVVNRKSEIIVEDYCVFDALDSVYSRVRAVTVDFREDRTDPIDKHGFVMNEALELVVPQCLSSPVLEDLQIHLSTFEDDSYRVLNEELVTNMTLAPRRMSLTVSGCGLNSPLQSLSPVLHTLILENVVPWNNCEQLAETLGSLTSLKVFEYRWTQDHYGDTIEYEGSWGSTYARLPRLERLVLSGFLVEDVSIFSALQLPPKAVIVFAPKTSHECLLNHSPLEEARDDMPMRLVRLMALTLLRHLDVAHNHGMVVACTTITRHGVELTLEYSNSLDRQTSSTAVSESGLPSITFDIPPFRTREQRDAAHMELILFLRRYKISSISYAGSLSSTYISRNLKHRAHELQEITLHSEEDVVEFRVCAHFVHFSALRILNIDCGLSAPAEMLQDIFKAMRLAEVAKGEDQRRALPFVRESLRKQTRSALTDLRSVR